MSNTELSLILIGFMTFVVVAAIAVNIINFNNKYEEK